MAKLQSMTGYGKEVLQLPGKKISIEVKSLNSKLCDINLRLPATLRAKEGAIRSQLSLALERGKIDANFHCEVTGLEAAPRINETLAEGYINQLAAIAKKTNTSGDLISAVMRLPDVVNSAEDELSAAEWAKIETALAAAISKLQGFRADEGARLETDLNVRLNHIGKGLEQVETFEEERKTRVKERLENNLEQLAVEVDKDRFEQELIYYLEKYDVTEEKVRLAAHLEYFQELMTKGGGIGKKLGFLSQEIGREINTLGSKANHAGLQKVVVNMKDELEKIKEQVLNIL